MGREGYWWEDQDCPEGTEKVAEGYYPIVVFHGNDIVACRGVQLDGGYSSSVCSACKRYDPRNPKEIIKGDVQRQGQRPAEAEKARV